MKKVWEKIENANRWHDSVVRKLDKYGIGILWVLFVSVSLLSLVTVLPIIFHQPLLMVAGEILIVTVLVARMAYVVSRSWPRSSH